MLDHCSHIENSAGDPNLHCGQQSVVSSAECTARGPRRDGPQTGHSSSCVKCSSNKILIKCLYKSTSSSEDQVTQRLIWFRKYPDNK